MTIRPDQRRGFTIVELLVVIMIIGLLLALLLPAVQAAREAGRRTTCKSNLKQIGLALHHYHQVRGRLPSGWLGPHGWSWKALLLPYLEQENLSKKLGVNAVNYKTVTPPVPGSDRDVALPIFICPSDAHRGANPFYRGYQKSNYPGVNNGGNTMNVASPNPGGTFGLATKISWAHFKKGQSNTFAVGEREMTSKNFRGAIWVRSINYDGQYMYGAAVAGTCGSRVRLNTIQSRIIGFSSLHPDGANFLMAGGEVRFINETIDGATYTQFALKGTGRVRGGGPPHRH